MRKLLLLVVLISVFETISGQPFGNEWIDYDQKYYRFKISETGVYRITYQDFLASGIPIALINPDHIKFLAHGAEVPIFVAGAADGAFNSGDYIEFFAEANDGRHDRTLYDEPSQHANPDYSLYNDTARYYITFDVAGDHARISETNNGGVDTFQPQPYVWFRSKQVFSNRYYDQPSLLESPPANDPNFRVSLSDYARGEGWLSTVFGYNTGNLQPIRQIDIATPAAYLGAGAPSAKAAATVVGVSDIFVNGADHFISIKVGIGQVLAVNQQYEGYRVNNFDFAIPPQDLGAATTNLTFTAVNGLGITRDEQALAQVQINYARLPDLDGANLFNFTYRFNPLQAKTRFDFLNITGDNPRIFARGSNAERISLTNEAGVFKALISNDASEQSFDCHLVTDQSVKTISGIALVGNNGFFTNFGQTQVDSAYVILTHKSLIAPAQEYSLYRQSRFNTVLVDVDELYDQFGYGVEKSGLSIRNFSNYILQTWSSTPQYLLLLGKDVRDATISNTVVGTRRNAVNFERNLLPSIGYPPSDVYLTAGLAGTFLEPAIRTGRVSARTPEELYWYLSKAQTFESQEHALWMKNAMHFGGGTSIPEQVRFASHLSNYEMAFEDSSFGGNVSTFLKSGSEPIQLNVSDEITELIEAEGVSLMTFFAHAGSEGFDQTIDNPANFEWNGRYPLLLGNGCFSGDYHAPTPSSTSEKYTILDQKGTIGFISSVGLGIEGDLHAFSTAFYDQLSLESYGQPIGEQIREAIRDIQYDSVLRRYLCLGMGLQGDPGIILNSFPYPDLSITADAIYFTPADITAEVDSFTVNVIVSNLARVTNQDFDLSIEHSTPSGVGDSTYVITVPGLAYVDTFAFKLPVDLQSGLGLHSFDVFVDLPEDNIRELAGFEVSNNQVVGKELFVSSGGIVPVYPYEYAVVPHPNPVLKASTGNPLAAATTYRIELDTTDLYNSPLLQTTEITQSGGLVEWQPTVNASDSTVYFWRCRETEMQDAVWRESSFQYIDEKSGWGQSQFFQFKNDNFLSTGYNRAERQVDFFTGTVSLTNNVLGNSAGFGNNILLNTSEVEYGACFSNRSIHLAIFDPVSFEAWGTNYNGQNPDHNFGNHNETGNCRPRVEYYFIYRQENPQQMQALADLLLSETIPDGHYVVLYTIRNVSYDAWEATPDIYTAFQSLGATAIGAENAQDNVPFSLIARKGDPSFLFELYGDTLNDVLNNVVQVPASGSTGKLVSRKIGPVVTGAPPAGAPTHPMKRQAILHRSGFWASMPMEPSHQYREQNFQRPVPTYRSPGW